MPVSNVKFSDELRNRLHDIKKIEPRASWPKMLVEGVRAVEKRLGINQNKKK